jgi:signal transduction histidine kinase
MERTRARSPGPAIIGVGVLALGVAAGAVAVAEGPGRYTTYPGRFPATAALSILAGLALVAAGLVSFPRQRRGATGVLAILAGLTSFAPAWIAWQDGPPLVPSVALVFAGFTFAFVFHLMLAYPSGNASRTTLRILVVLVYAEALLAALALALTRDPYFDPGCWANCNVNAFLVRSLPSVARRIQSFDRWFVEVAAIVLIAICIVRMAAGSRPALRALAPVAVPGMLFALATLVRAMELGRATIEDPFNEVFFATFVLAGVALTLLAAGLIAAIVRMHLQRRAVAQIVTGLDAAPVPGTLQSALSEALGDPELRIAYRPSNAERYADSSGRPVDEPAAVAGRTNTKIVRNDRTIAVISHSDAVTLDHQIGPAVRLALENERLQAELLSDLEHLRASRARIVETGDDERRLLERDLHDGAQQRLVALSYDIRLARAEAGNDGAVTLLERAVDQTQRALEDLRDVAHGIYPAVLSEAGLAPALATFADTAPMVIDVRADDRRYPAPIETSVYFAITEAIDDASLRGAGRVSVSAVHDDGRLIVTVEDDGAVGASPMTAISDRVGALGGDVVVGDTACRMEIPCE